MYLQIPVKLEQYVDEIRRQTNSIEERNKFTLARLGVTTSDTSKKIVYLLYNPFATVFRVDANFFTKSSNIFKLYPAEFEVAPNSAAAFVAYISSGDSIMINESKLINDMKDRIGSRILSKYDYSENEIFEAKNNLKIKVSDVDFSNTMYLDPESVQSLIEDNVVDYKSRYESLIDISLEKIDTQEKQVCLELKFTNNDSNLDIRINDYRLKIFDLNNKIFVNVGTSFIIKHNSSKYSSVYLNKIEFGQIARENMQLKVTLL